MCGQIFWCLCLFILMFEQGTSYSQCGNFLQNKCWYFGVSIYCSSFIFKEFLFNMSQVHSYESNITYTGADCDFSCWHLYIDLEFGIRFIGRMERHPHPEFGIFSGCDDNANGSCSLSQYLVASWHGISSCGCCSFPKYPCNSSLLLLVQLLALIVAGLACCLPYLVPVLILPFIVVRPF